ncbi:MAG: SDR family oxidoreductase [Candidatus Doudnabacteria bacterium]|nr:SDR family oxidoreductase [Candidatus Doudnabacteria bacterium]
MILKKSKIKKTVLVAGGAGFLGSHLCSALLEAGHNVVCVDNLHTGRKINIKPFLKNPRFIFKVHDVVKPLNLKVSEIYHLASPASPPHYQKNPLATFQANVWGCWNLLELARKNQAKFLFASTSEIYGDPLVHPQTESYWGNVNTIGIRSCYDESKRAGETLCSDFRRMYGVEAKIIRIFNTYGPNMDPDDGRVVSNFIVQALQGKPITIYGKGQQTRSFQYVDDLISGIVKVMGKSNFYGPVNLGNPKEFTILQLANLVIKLTGSKSKIIFKDLPKDDPKQRRPNIALAQNNLGWSPKIQLHDGLAKTIAYFEGIVKMKS